MDRRDFVFGMAGALALGTFGARAASTAGRSTHLEIGTLQDEWQGLGPAGWQPDLDLTPLELDASEWKTRLSDLAYDVLRKEGTERPFSHPYNDLKQPGVFLCAGCELPLFTSDMKFDSGTGWPSFFTVIPGHMETKKDFKLIWPRTEYHCIRCGGHQGHVFDDGPRPTGDRWCNNGVALKFLPQGG